MEPLCGPGPQANGRGEAPRRPELSIVVPVYPSEDCLRALIAATAAALAPTGRTYEVVLVKDCSPDGWKSGDSRYRHPPLHGPRMRPNRNGSFSGRPVR
jgi:hypothetical protein